jgi:hypothetical protein
MVETAWNFIDVTLLYSDRKCYPPNLLVSTPCFTKTLPTSPPFSGGFDGTLDSFLFFPAVRG